MKRILLYLGVFLCLFLANYHANAQAPSISYSSATNVYSVGNTITSLTPTNSGGSVPATVYATVTTWAGNNFGTSGTTNGTGTGAKFNSPRWMTINSAGNMYVADAGNNEIRKVIMSTVAVSLLAGNNAGGSGTTNATGSLALFNGPYAITDDGSGNAYVADFNNNEIRKVVESTGAVSLVAGSSTTGSGLTNGNGTSALFNTPAGIIYDPTYNCFYIADFANNEIRKMTNDGNFTVSLFAGSTSGASGSTDGTGSAATFNGPNGITVDGSGNVYVCDQNNNEIRMITPGGVVSTFAGSTTSGSSDGTGTAATFLTPRGIDIDISGNLYVTDSGNDLIRMITPAAVVTTVAGSGATALTNGVGTAAAFNQSRGITIDQSTGNIYIADYGNNVIRKMIGTGYLIYPSLPSGLSFDSTTGTISGTPTATSAATTYTIMGFNASGCSTTTISIAVGRTVDWKAGSNSTAWNTAGNWSTNTVPTAADNVRIGVVNYSKNQQPAISASDVTVNSITFGSAHTVILTVTSPRTLTVGSSVTVNSGATPTVTGSGNINISPGAIVNISGTLTTTLTGKLTLKSDATGDASIGQIAAGAITGSGASTIYVERYITGGSSTYRGYRLLSSPVYASTVSSNNVYSINYLKSSIFLTATTANGTGGFDNTSSANPTLYLYRENMTPAYTTFTGSNFRGINNINSSPSYTIDGDGSGYSIPAGNGYLCFFRGDRSKATFGQETVTTYVPQTVTLTASGTLNIGQVTVKDWFTPSLSTLSYTSGSPSAVRGYNLVGNPYASAIDWDTFQSSSTTTGIYGLAVGATIYVLDPVSHNYGAYISGNGGIGGTNNATNIISSGQAFFVVASSTSAKLIFNESAKTSSQNTGTNLLMGKPVNYANNQFLKLRLAKDSVNTDETVVRFNSQGNVNYVEGLDAPYKGGYGTVSLSGISKDNIDLAIDVIPLPHQQKETIGLNVIAKANGTYTLSLSDLVSVPQLYDVWLIDRYKKDSLDMRQYKTYAFDLKTSDTSSFGANRFALVIRQNQAYAYKLVNFTATKIPDVQQVQVNWTTINEGNYTNFTVERSIDGGKTFNVLGGLSAAGNGNYGLVDKSPVTGANVYRLKQEDINNMITYSNVVTIQYASPSNSLASRLTLYPNPAVNTLSLNINAPLTESSSAYNIRFMNSSGIIVKQLTLAQSSWQGSVNNLQPGSYIIQVFSNKTENLVGQTKFVKL